MRLKTTDLRTLDPDFEFRVVLLQDKLFTKAKEFSLLLFYSWLDVLFAQLLCHGYRTKAKEPTL